MTILPTGLPNIRIQVNNENLQSPPYLLEAIKEAEAAQSLTTANKVNSTKAQQSASTNALGAGSERANPPNSIINPSKPIEADSTDNGEETEPNNFSVIKEETIEEILDLEPESVLKLSPESIINGVSPAEYSRISDPIGSDSSIHNDYAQPDGKNDQTLLMRPENAALRSSNLLPVTSSHLKRPSEAISDVESLIDSGSSNSGGPQFPVNNKPKSDVSPTVTVDELSSSVNKKSAPPDTWEPSQIMNGVSNASQVPATVNREYGSNSRTRITLGGGYVRDRLPPLGVPSQYGPEKPIVPLERPSQPSANNNPTEDSKVIEIPEKVIIPAGIFTASKKVGSVESKPSQDVFKPDPRCPKIGSTTIEHPTACDKYYYCSDGIIEERICPNGLMYGTHDTVVENCIHRWKAACDDKIQPNPISSPGCRWQYGIFSVQGSPKCSPDFYECKAGRFEVKKCSIDGQIYDDRTKSCKFAETVGCASEVLADFHCPPDDQSNTYWPFPRYFLNERALIHCINDKPEIVRCTNDERVDPEHLHCVPISKSSQQQSPELTERKAKGKKKATD